MHAHASHLPSCDPLPPREGGRARATLALATIALLLPLPAQGQELRARDLSILEDILVDTIQGAIQTTVRAVNTENVEAQEAAHRDQQPVPIRYLFRTGAQTQARGMYLDEYGVIFTVQVPSMSYTFATAMAAGSVAIWRPGGSAETVIAGAVGEEMQMRAQMDRMRSEMQVLADRVARETSASGESSPQVQELRARLAASQREFQAAIEAFLEYTAADEPAPEDPVDASRRTPVTRGEARRIDASERVTADRVTGLRLLTTASAEELAAAEALAQDQRNQIEGAVIDAAIEGLEQYGHIMHGLQQTDRIAVVLLPSSYLNPVGSWARATQRDQEFIISVLYRDVVERDHGNLSAEDFRQRVTIQRSREPRQ